MEVRTDQASAVMLYSLLGGHWKEPRHRQGPVTRFCEVLIDLSKRGWPTKSSSLTEAFDAWDARLGHPSTLQGVSRRPILDRSYLESLEANARLNDILGNRVGVGADVKTMVDLLTKYVSGKERMVATFLADPDKYISAFHYIDLAHDELPQPALRVMAEPGLLEAEIRDDDYWVHQSAVVLGREFRTSIAFDAPDSERSILSGKEACRLYDELTFLDILFSEFDRDFHAADLQTVRRVFGGELHLMSVIATDDEVPVSSRRRDWWKSEPETGSPPQNGDPWIRHAGALWVPRRFRDER
jgi:hypothetical protein